MYRQTRRVLLMCAAAASAVVLSATSAVAQVSISIDNPNTDGSYSAHSDLTVLTDFDTGTQFTCETVGDVNASDASGTIQSVTSQPLPHTAEDAVTSLGFNNCTSNFGDVDVDAIGSHDAYDLTVETFPGQLADGSAADGVGRIVSSTNTPLAHVEVSFCSFDVVGDAPGAFLNEDNPANGSGTGQLVLDPDLDPAETGTSGLEAANVSFCFGLVNNGDALGYDAVYDIDDPTAPSISVTSP